MLGEVVVFILVVSLLVWIFKKKQTKRPVENIEKQTNPGPTDTTTYKYRPNWEERQDYCPEEIDTIETIEEPKKDYYSLDFDFSVFRRRRIFSDNEQDFYRKLADVVGENCLIFSKVGLKEILKIDEELKFNNKDKYYSAFNRVTKMHLDFVLVSKKNHFVECIIEVDDKSHSQNMTMPKDRFKDEVIKTLSLPFVRIPALKTGAYTHEYIRKYLEKATSLALKSKQNVVPMNQDISQDKACTYGNASSSKTNKAACTDKNDTIASDTPCQSRQDC